MNTFKDLMNMEEASLTGFDVTVLKAAYSLGNGVHTLGEIAAMVYDDGYGGLCYIADSLDKMRGARLSFDITEAAKSYGMMDPDSGEPYESIDADTPLLAADKVIMTDEHGVETVACKFLNLRDSFL